MQCYAQVIKTHTKFVQDLRYAPGGNHFASVGADAKAFLYDGKTGDVVGEFGNVHTGTITALSWIDDRSFATASLDSTVKLCTLSRHRQSSLWITIFQGMLRPESRYLCLLLARALIISKSASSILRALLSLCQLPAT